MGSCPQGSCPRGSCPKSGYPRGSSSQGSCPRGSCPKGSCPGGSCPRGSCHVTKMNMLTLGTPYNPRAMLNWGSGGRRWGTREGVCTEA